MAKNTRGKNPAIPEWLLYDRLGEIADECLENLEIVKQIRAGDVTKWSSFKGNLHKLVAASAMGRASSEFFWKIAGAENMVELKKILVRKCGWSDQRVLESAESWILLWFRFTTMSISTIRSRVKSK